MTITAFAIYMVGVLLIASPFIIDTVKKSR